MRRITTRDSTARYDDGWGAGRPVLFSPGWPLPVDARADQTPLVGARRRRGIAHVDGQLRAVVRG